MGSAEMQSALWSQAPRDWVEGQEPLHTPLWEEMIEATGIGPATRVLDAGCGGAGACILFAKAGARVSGVDASGALIGIAQERLPEGTFRVGDLEELPYDDDSFDVVIAANSVQYAADPVAALREIKRVTSPGGRIAVGIWGQAQNCEFRHVLEAIAKAMPEPPKGGGPFALSAPGAVEALLAQAGLTADGRSEVPCPMTYADRDAAWRAQASAGPFQGAMRAAGEAAIKDAFMTSIGPFTDDGGAVRFENTMLCVTATV